MLNQKFALDAMTFQGLVSQEMRDSATTRVLGFFQFAFDLLTWFEAYPGLERAKLLTVVTQENNLEQDVDMRFVHHFVLKSTGATLPHQGDAQVHAYVEANLPYAQMGKGAFELTRTDPLVIRFKALAPEQVSEFRGLVFELAYRIDQAFGRLYLSHDLPSGPGAA